MKEFADTSASRPTLSRGLWVVAKEGKDPQPVFIRTDRSGWIRIGDLAEALGYKNVLPRFVGFGDDYLLASMDDWNHKVLPFYKDHVDQGQSMDNPIKISCEDERKWLLDLVEWLLDATRVASSEFASYAAKIKGD